MERTESAIPRLFGTDGVRGTAGLFPLDPPTIRRIGAALIRALPRSGDQPRVLVGRDTRESGVWIENELARGINAAGAEVTSAGVVPTPAIAFLTQREAFDAGIVISASHNPFADNGIKVFSGGGEKFTEGIEREVEAVVADRSWAVTDGDAPPLRRADLMNAYLDRLRGIFPEAALLKGVRLAVDCANGATAEAAPRLFQSLGFETRVIANTPDGRNINLDCGSTHPDRLARLVRESGSELGVAFDGDGDRAIFVDNRGGIVNGDAVLFLCARQLQREHRLNGDAVVATVMSNIGLETALAKLGISLVRCPVGDKYVMEEMLSRNISLGGEQSGHIIFSEYLYTGDGLCTALCVLRTLALTGRTLAELVADYISYPQVLLNVRVREKVDLTGLPHVVDAIARVEDRLRDQGRLLVRYSGTEPLLRVMIEGQREDEIRAWAKEIAEAVKTSLG